jgi:RNA polymerase sigma-70 factor (sigma-E family)
MTGPHDDEFTDFVAGRLGALRRIGYLLCQDWQRADDLVQTAITRLYARWERARTLEHLDAYARTILVREFLAEQRSGWARRVIVGAPLPDLPGSADDPEAVLDMRAALAVLPPSQRATIVLRFYCDLTVEQTADLLGCTAGTIKSNTSRAMQTLRQQLAGSPALGARRSAPRCPGGDAAGNGSPVRAASGPGLPEHLAPHHPIPQHPVPHDGMSRPDMRPQDWQATRHG